MKNNVVIIVSIVIFAVIPNSNSLLNRERCRQPMVAGRCFGDVPSFAYNAITGKCEEFIYGGCGGNENRFNTYRECKKACRGV